MKTSTLVASLVAAAGLVNAIPAPQPVVTLTVVPIAATSSPYPDKPVTNEIQYANYDEKSDTDKATRTKVHNAFVPWAAMMQKGIESVANSDDKTFDRWFPPTVKVKGGSIDARGYVSGVYRQLLQPDPTTPKPKATVATIVNDKDDYAKTCKTNTYAYFTRDIGRFHVCDKGLKQPTAATDIKCQDLGTQVSSKMESLTSTIVHEFMHWDKTGDTAPNSVGHITDVIYGAGSCSRLRDGGDKQKTFINADSYMWMAVNAYYNSICGKSFGDPYITSEDFEESDATLLESPEYDVNVSSGVLAGV